MSHTAQVHRAENLCDTRVTNVGHCESADESRQTKNSTVSSVQYFRLIYNIWFWWKTPI